MCDDLIPLDTTAAAARKQIEILRAMDISDRAEMTFQLSDNLRATIEAGVRQRHPDYNDEEVKKAVIRLTVGEKLFKEAFPGDEIVP